MACISREPRCGTADTPVTPNPLKDFLKDTWWIYGSIVGIIAILNKLGLLEVIGETLFFDDIAIGTAATAGALAGFATAAGIILITLRYAQDRCNKVEGEDECVAGVVEKIKDTSPSIWETLLPFRLMHDRVDVVVKSRYWDTVESGLAFVHCTDDGVEERISEIMRCYFFDQEVCDAARGSVIGAAFGAPLGIAGALLAAAAIGCATIILCFVAIIVAILVAGAMTLAGAAIGGHIGKDGGSSPTADTGDTIAIGQYVVIRGNMLRRADDKNANVFWWVTSVSLAGDASANFDRPYSYCDVDEELEADCPSGAIIE